MHSLLRDTLFITKIGPNVSSTKTYLKKEKNIKDFTLLRHHNLYIHPGDGKIIDKGPNLIRRRPEVVFFWLALLRICVREG